MNYKQLFITVYKVFFGLLAFTSIAIEISVLVERGLFNAVNFFSYFTIITNILVFLAFIISAIAENHGVNKKISAIRSAVTVYILLVGIAFSILLSGLDNVIFTIVPWDNIVLHYIIPVAVLIDYLIDRPYRTDFNKALSWLAFPLAYLAYSLMRGAITGWYPYPFLNPSLHGWSVVIMTVMGIVVLSVALTWLVVRFSKKR